MAVSMCSRPAEKMVEKIVEKQLEKPLKVEKPARRTRAGKSTKKQAEK